MIVSKMSTPLKCALWILLYGVMISFTINNTYPLQGDESFYSVSSAWMVKNDSYLTPYYFGEPRFQKPILTYLVVAASYIIFGISLWSARLPIVLFSCGTLMITFFFSRLYQKDSRFGFLSVVILSSSALFISFSRIAMTDPILTFFSTLALYLFAKASFEPGKMLRYHTAAFVATGCAFLTKGPAALLLLVAYSIYLWSIRPAQWKRLLFNLCNPLNLFIFFALILPWYLYSYVLNSSGLMKHVISETGQFTNFPLAYIPRHILFYLVVLIVFLLPFSSVATYQTIKRKLKLPHELWLPLIFGITYFLFFTLFVPADRERYLLPAVPSLSVITAYILYSTTSVRRWTIAGQILTTVIIAVFIVYPLFTGEILRNCVSAWKKEKSDSLAIYNLKILQKGWVQVMAGGGALVDSHEADYIITDEQGRDSLPDYHIVYAGFEREELRFVKNRPVVKGKTFYLLRKAAIQ